MLTKVEAVAALIEKEVKDFTDVAVVGISGGVDSAVVASICVAALGAKNVYLLSMPYDEIDLNTFNSRSAELAEKLGANHLIVPIKKATDGLLASLEPAFKEATGLKDPFDRLTNGNTRARMRMASLYAIAAELTFRFAAQHHEKLIQSPAEVEPLAKRVRVMGTGNASEDLIGYDTKGGDALADLFVIGDIFKSEVYQLAKYYEVPKSIIEAPPSAGLYEGQIDVDELGYSYEQLEPALSALHRAISRGVPDGHLSIELPEFIEVKQEISQFVIDRFLAHAHKHRAPRVVSLRHTEYVKDIWTRS